MEMHSGQKRALHFAFRRGAETAAERTIQERSMLILSARDTEAFVNAVLNPAEPRAVLRRAAQQYKRTKSR